VGAAALSIVLAVIAVFLAWRARRIWHDPDYFEHSVALSRRFLFYFSERTQRGLVRGAAIDPGMLALVSAFLLLGSLRDVNLLGPWVAVRFATLAVVWVFVILGLALLKMIIAWFNCPKLLVPPYLRAEYGSLQRVSAPLLRESVACDNPEEGLKAPIFWGASPSGRENRAESSLELPFSLPAATDLVLQTIQPLGRNVRCSRQLADGSRVVRFEVPVGRWGLNLAAVELHLSEGRTPGTYVGLRSTASSKSAAGR
jgi:hypothetical protein